MGQKNNGIVGLGVSNQMDHGGVLQGLSASNWRRGLWSQGLSVSVPAAGGTGVQASSEHQQLEREEHVTGVMLLAVNISRDHIAHICEASLKTSDWRDLSVFQVFFSVLNPMCMGVYVEFGSIFRADLTSEWEENLDLNSETEVGKGVQHPLMDTK